jgi:hypothetical protein
MMRRLLVLLLAVANPAAAASLDLPVHGAGISFGNSTRFSGLRFNAVDSDIEDLRGFGLTLWKPRPSPDGSMRGLYAGIYGQRAGELHGIHVGLVGSSARIGRGIFVAGLGMAFGAEDDGSHHPDGMASGLFVAGLGMGAEWMRGIAIAGLGLGADRFDGIAIAGLGMGADTVRGLAFGGLGVGGDRFTGIAIGGLGMGADRFVGIGIGGLGVGADTLRGLVIGGLACGADELRGIAIAGLVVKANDLSGAALSTYTRVHRSQRGITISLVNIAHTLHGLQLGVLNWAGNNPAPFKLLPVLNVNFGDS